MEKHDIKEPIFHQNLTKSDNDLEDKTTGETCQSASQFDLESPFNKFAFLLFGIGMLLPWNASLAAMDFFVEQFPDYDPKFSILVAVSVPMFAVQAVIFPFVKRIPLQVKLTAAFALATIITFLLVIVPLAISDQSKAYWTVIGLDIAFGCAYALLQAALYGTAGPAPALTANLMVGLGVSGLGINIIRMILLASVSN